MTADPDASNLPSVAERFHLLVDGVKEYAIFMLDPGGAVLTWNAGAERIKGYSESEIVGQPFSVFFEEDDVVAGKPQRLLTDAVADGKSTDEGWRIRKDGSRFWANVVITALFDGDEIRGFAKITRDDTDRRIADEQSRHLEVVLDRERVAQALNDAVIKRIYSAGLTLESAKTFSQNPRLDEHIERAVAELDQAINDLRTIMFGFDDANDT